jgi:hypothetical protein
MPSASCASETAGLSKRSLQMSLQEVSMLLDNIRLSVRNLRHRPKRSWLTIVGHLDRRSCCSRAGLPGPRDAEGLSRKSSKPSAITS